jgi:serine/threonine-protein kinase
MTTLEDVSRLLPDYALGAEVGRGAFGVVWRARHLRLGRDVAVKQLTGPVDDDSAARFRREARILAALDHPHVVRVFDYREDGNTRLLVMELLGGGTLADRRRAGLDLTSSVASVMAAAAGLHHVHEQGVLHRDVKPENLMFDAREVLKVTDFGIARVPGPASAAGAIGEEGQLFGTPAYVAPEQAAPFFGGGWPPVGPAADQYGLAAVVYELISGRLTHDATDGWVALCTARMRVDAPRLSGWVPGLPEVVDAEIMRALARDPASRHPSTEAFAVALGDAMRAAYGDHWYEGSEVAIREPGPVRDAAVTSSLRAPAAPPARPRRGRGGLVALGVVSALVAGGVAYVASDPGGGASGSDSVSGPLPLHLASEWSVRTGGHVFSSPAVTGPTVVVGSEDGKVYGLDATSGARRWTASTPRPVRASAAIDGDTAYVGGFDGTLYAFDTATGAVRWKQPLGIKIVSTAAIADGFVLVGADGLDAFDAVTGAPRWELPTGALVVSSPAVSAGTVVVGADDGSLHAARVADGTPLWTQPVGGPVWSSPVIDGGVVYAGGTDGSFVAVDVGDGQVRWRRSLGAAVKSSPVVRDGRVIVGTGDGRLVALDTATGHTDWTFRARGPVDSSPATLGDDVVVGSDDGSVYAVDAATGALDGRYATGGPVVSSPLVVGDTVIVGNQDGRVLAIGGFR